MVTTRRQIVSASAAARVTNAGTNPGTTVTIHNTGNQAASAGAAAHANLQSNGNSRAASWHWTVDNHEAVQSFEHTARCWHAGNATGNNTSIAIEVAMNMTGAGWAAAAENATQLAAMILKQRGLGSGALRQHANWMAKNCPEWIRAGKDGYSWDWFVRRTAEHLGGPAVLPPAGGGTPTLHAMGWRTLYQGLTGEDVRALQNWLITAGYPVGTAGADASFGPATHNAVIAYQRAVGVAADGYVGSDTQTAMRAGLGIVTPGVPVAPGVGNLTADGWWGPGTTGRAQEVLGTPIDRTVVSQWEGARATNPGLVGGWEWVKDPKGSPLVRAIQDKLNAERDAGLVADGIWGRNTALALQRALGTTADGVVPGPSPMVRALQTNLNDGRLF